jgi:hypothetical protein
LANPEWLTTSGEMNCCDGGMKYGKTAVNRFAGKGFILVFA